MMTGRGAEDSRSAQGRVRTPPKSRLSSTTIFFWRQRPTFASGSAGRRGERTPLVVSRPRTGRFTPPEFVARRFGSAAPSRPGE